MKLYAIKKKNSEEFVWDYGLINITTSQINGKLAKELTAELEHFVKIHPEYEIVPLRIEPTEPCEECDGPLPEIECDSLLGCTKQLVKLDSNYCSHCGRRLI